MIYTYDEALSESLKYFNGDELPAKTFIDKYALRNEQDELIESNPDQMHRRMAREFARIEKTKFKKPYSEEFIYSLFKNFGYIIPQGSPMYGLGNPKYVSLSNCVVIENVIDSYGGICYSDEQLVQLCKRRCGVGINISNIRPDGFLTNNSSRSATGIIPFMERFSNSIREVGQNNRRGALMLVLNVHHPQILDFTTIKNDLNKVTGANISILLTDEFLNAVKNDEEYEQRWPIENPVYTRKVKAQDVWKQIIKNAWKMAEPGLLFIDNIKRESPSDCYADVGFETIATNPCQPKWAKILSKEGIKEFSEIKEGDDIWSSEGWTKVIKKWSTGIKKVYKYVTTAGIFYGTENHRLVSNQIKVEVKDAESIDIITGPYISDKQIDPQYVMDGLVFGDGSIHKASNNLIHLYIGKDDQDYFNSEVNEFITLHRPGISQYAYEVKTNLNYTEIDLTYKRMIPDRYLKADRNKVISFLRGLYSANGSICGNRVTLKASSFKVIEAVQCMLSSLGIRSYYTTNKTKKVKFENGEYQCKESYDLNISSHRNLFYNLIGFIQKYKNDKLERIINELDSTNREKINFEIISVEEISEEEVFDIKVDNNSHTYWSQCCNVSNCSEIPMSNDCCRLMLENLFAFVTNPFTSKAKFNYTKFYTYSKILQRLMDDLVDLELEAINRIIDKILDDPQSMEIKQRELDLWYKLEESCINGRRTGSGITALGDTLAALGIDYDSKKGERVAEKIYQTFKLACYESSVEMAKELGAFPIWDKNKEKNNPFLLRIKDEYPELYNKMQKYGRRNIALLTTAPAGSVSLMAGPVYFGTTSGFESLFMMWYTRRKKICDQSTEKSKVAYVDNKGDKWEEFDVYHPKLKMWMDINQTKDYKQSPYYGNCAEDLNWKQRVNMLGKCIKHIDHSISCTINLPEYVTEEEVSVIYNTAWKKKLKGLTIYRKNCRAGVLIDKSNNRGSKLVKTTAPKRLKEMPCDVHCIKRKGNTYFILVGLLDNEPYEIFIIDTLNNPVMALAEYSQGKIIKVKRGVYNFAAEDYTLTNVTKYLPNTDEIITRLVSTSLRHGADISFIVHQLEKAEGDIESLGKCLARVLKKYIKEGVKVSGEECPTCSGELIRQEGCILCKGCGYSKC